METMIKKSGDFKTTTATLSQNNNNHLKDTGLNKMTVARTPEPGSKASSGVSSCSTTPEPSLKGERGARSTPDSDAGIQTKGCEVYVTRIPRHLKETDLLDVFGKIGKIADLRLMMGQTGQNKGYAYIRYGAAQDAKEAIKILNNYEISPNRHLVVTKSVDNRRLWVNGIPKSKSTAEIRRDMERLTSGVIDIILYPSQTDKTRSRGYMFVEYESHKAAAVARRKLSQGNVSVCGQEVGQVDWAEPEHEVDEETMSSVKILFVRNLMMTTSEETLRNIFNSKGNNEVERVRKTKDFAFVHFSTRVSAEQALAQSHNLVIDQAEVEVLWSKPVDKKLYNTRKTLTKAFTLGTDYMDDGALKNLSPVKRGAAGIQGLGAPGTAPSKHLVQKYVSMTRAGGPGVAPGVLSGLTGGHISPVQLGHGKMSSQPRQYPFYRSAPDLLREFCLLSNWGEPIYHYSGTEGLYLCKVTLPNLPSQPNSFQGLQYKMTAEEARLDTVQQVLDLLRIPQIYATSIANYNQMYQMTAAGQLQGIPLTIPHQQTIGDAGGIVAGQPHPMRLQYPPEPYRSNYAYLVNSMAGMNLNMCA